jgi:hypothetical protein
MRCTIWSDPHTGLDYWAYQGNRPELDKLIKFLLDERNWFEVAYVIDVTTVRCGSAPARIRRAGIEVHE